MSGDLIWVHADALSRDHPVFDAAPDDARAVFIWDAADIARRGWSLKRCVFLLRCLAEMDVDVVEGEFSKTMDKLAPKRVYAAATPDPTFKAIASHVEADLIFVADKPFVTLPEGADIKRFFRYWNTIRSSALSPTEEGGMT